MARPRKDSEGTSARDRLAAAFWGMLAEMPLREMTVSAISSRAQVNHNTFYYHFSSIEDMAQTLFEENMLPELPKVLLPMISAGVSDLSNVIDNESDVLPAEIQAHFARAKLFARSDSPLLVGILRDSIQGLWLETAGVSLEDLDKKDTDQLAFVFGGLVSLIGEMGETASLDRMTAFVESPVGCGVFATLTSIASAERGKTR